MLKTRVTLGNIYLALLNLIKKFMFLMFKDSFPQCLDFHSFFHSFISFHLQEKNKYWFFFCFFFLNKETPQKMHQIFLIILL